MLSIAELFLELSIFSWRDIVELGITVIAVWFIVSRLVRHKPACMPLLTLWMSAICAAWFLELPAIQLLLYGLPLLFPFVFWLDIFSYGIIASSTPIQAAVKEADALAWPTEVIRALIAASYKQKNVLIICTNSLSEITRYMLDYQKIDVAVHAGLLERLIMTSPGESALVITTRGILRMFDITWVDDLYDARGKEHHYWMNIFSQCAFLPDSVVIMSLANQHTFVLMMNNKIHEYLSAAQVLNKLEQFVEQLQRDEHKKKIKGQDETVYSH